MWATTISSTRETHILPAKLAKERLNAADQRMDVQDGCIVN
ncbi:hypothetical protein MtrunA17_Chr5g0430741 [Medicago truncatula]|uniref:Uncharacterized protein n=1 Tax=Medicago truncatula TaxID=3880 RepID=A0A396HVM1_MEDTR|nr:hypothetical protein MtrunA17_Chr5g0430741 [Medicago truncatula]